MVAAASARGRTASPTPTPVVNKRLRPSATWVVIGIPIVLLTAVVWQLASSALHSEAVIREAVSVGRVSLEADPAGTRVDFVLVDRVGQQTTIDGTLKIKLREPDGAIWQTSRTVAAADFRTLADGGLLAGRLGYSLAIPTSDWARPPRHGGAGTVTIEVVPGAGGPTFSTVAEERFP